MRIFKTNGFARFARREKIADKSLREAIAQAERGLVEADLGGGLGGQMARPNDFYLRYGVAGS